MIALLLLGWAAALECESANQLPGDKPEWQRLRRISYLPLASEDHLKALLARADALVARAEPQPFLAKSFYKFRKCFKVGGKFFLQIRDFIELKPEMLVRPQFQPLGAHNLFRAYSALNYLDPLANPVDLGGFALLINPWTDNIAFTGNNLEWSGLQAAADLCNSNILAFFERAFARGQLPDFAAMKNSHASLLSSPEPVLYDYFQRKLRNSLIAPRHFAQFHNLLDQTPVFSDDGGPRALALRIAFEKNDLRVDLFGRRPRTLTVPEALLRPLLTCYVCYDFSDCASLASLDSFEVSLPAEKQGEAYLLTVKLEYHRRAVDEEAVVYLIVYRAPDALAGPAESSPQQVTYQANFAEGLCLGRSGSFTQQCLHDGSAQPIDMPNSKREQLFKTEQLKTALDPFGLNGGATAFHHLPINAFFNTEIKSKSMCESFFQDHRLFNADAKNCQTQKESVTNADYSARKGTAEVKQADTTPGIVVGSSEKKSAKQSASLADTKGGGSTSSKRGEEKPTQSTANAKTVPAEPTTGEFGPFLSHVKFDFIYCSQSSDTCSLYVFGQAKSYPIGSFSSQLAVYNENTRAVSHTFVNSGDKKAFPAYPISLKEKYTVIRKNADTVLVTKKPQFVASPVSVFGRQSSDNLLCMINFNTKKMHLFACSNLSTNQDPSRSCRTLAKDVEFEEKVTSVSFDFEEAWDVSTKTLSEDTLNYYYEPGILVKTWDIPIDEFLATKSSCRVKTSANKRKGVLNSVTIKCDSPSLKYFCMSCGPKWSTFPDLCTTGFSPQEVQLFCQLRDLIRV